MVTVGASTRRSDVAGAAESREALRALRGGRKLETGADALALLRELGGSPRLLRHHELVLEAAVAITDALARKLGARFDAGLVQVGAALHDVGKLVHPDELHEP